MNIQTLTPLNLRETSPSCKISTMEASRICPSPLYTACIVHNLSIKPQLANHDFVHNLSIKPQLANHNLSTTYQSNHNWPTTILSTTHQSNHNWPTTICPQLINQTTTGQPRFCPKLINQTTTGGKPIFVHNQSNHNWWPTTILSTIYQSNHNCPSVWRIRDVYPGSRIRLFSIPDPNCLHPGSRIPDPHQRI
jgi:hypothetical protein